MRTRLFKADATAKTQTLWHDHTDGSVTVERQQDVEELVESNKAEYRSWDERSRWGVGRKVAEIPMVTYMQLKKEGIVDDPVRFKRWLNDRDNLVFRTAPGRV